MERPEWDEPPEGDAPASYPPAPLPLHERSWRHPSELDRTELFVIPVERPTNRHLLLFAGLAGLACATGLILLLLPTGSGNEAAGGRAMTATSLTVVPALSLTSDPAPAAVVTADAAGGDPAWLGVRASNMADSAGVRIDWMAAGSPADEAGVHVGDRIVKVDDDELADTAELGACLARRSPGTRILLTLERDGEQREIEVVLDSAP